MKIKNLLLAMSLMAFSSTSFALITIDEDFTTSGNFSATDNYKVTNGATFTIYYPNDAAITTHGQMNDFGITVDAGSKFILDWSKGLDFVMKSPSATTPTTFDFYGTFEKKGTAGNNIVIADQAANNVVWNFHDGSVGQIAEGATKFNLEVRRGTGTVNVYTGATLSGVDNFNIGGRNDSNGINGTLNVAGGTMTVGAWVRLGNTALNEGNAGKAQLYVTDGGVLNTRDFGTNIGTGYTATAEIKDLGSKLIVSNAVTLGAITDSRSSSKFTVYTGANFKNAGLTSNANSDFVFGLDGNLEAADTTAMLTTPKLTVNTANSEKTFSFETSELGAMAGMTSGDTFDVLLIDTLTSVVFNGTTFTLSTMSEADLQNMFDSFISFDFAGNEYWEAFDKSDLHWANNKLTLQLTYVPEASTYAAIFGALALAFVVYRRKTVK